MTLVQIRDITRLVSAILFCWLYIPHLIMGLCSGKRDIVLSDVKVMKKQITIAIPDWLSLLYLLHNNKYYRTVYYHRIGPVRSAFIRWYRPSDKYFQISATTKIGEKCEILHPYSTILNAKSIGNNFTCLHCSTIGSKDDKRPTIGNNVKMSAHSIIIGDVHIGNNVIIGAGSVVVKDVPDNCIVAGNPARIIKRIENA